MSKNFYRFITLSLCLLPLANSYARIKLITLPIREHVEIQLENKHTTIIEEERIVPLKKGNNTIDFSWHNSSIRPETIIFRVLENENGLKTNILSVSYPPNESALTWTVSASQNGSARVRISYAIDRLTKKYHYIARIKQDESRMELVQYIKVDNQSGESFNKAQMNTGLDKVVTLPMAINETQQFINNNYKNVAIEKTYTVNASKLGYRDRTQDTLNVLMHYQIHNDKAHNMGAQSLVSGKYRLYQQDKEGTAVFIGEDWGEYTAIDDKTELFIGQARDIVVKRVIERKKRQRINGNLYNLDVLLSYEIENFKDKPVTLIIEESLPYLNNETLRASSESGLEWEIGSDTTLLGKAMKQRTNSKTIAYQISLPARTEATKKIKLTKKLNINFKNQW